MKKLLAFFLVLLLVEIALSQDLNKNVLDLIAAESQKTNTDALIVSKDGKIVYKNYFGKEVKQIEAMSATKSVVSLAIGLLIDKGLLKNLEEPVSAFYPEWKQGRKRNITVRHLLEHTSGLQNVANAGIEVEVAPDVVQLALAAELDAEPGTIYSYNNKATNLLAGIIERASGMKMDAFLKKHLFDKIGVAQFRWRTDKHENPLGMAGLQIFPEDFAKIGQLILDKGKHNGEQIISESWLKASFSPISARHESGFLWQLVFARQYMIIDDVFLNKIKPNTDAETFLLLEKLKGKYESSAEIQNKGRTVYTPEQLSRIAEALLSVLPAEMRIENEGGIVGYAAVGYLGQYLIVLPKRNIVVVRMISAESHRQTPNNSEFSLLRRLAKQL